MTKSIFLEKYRERGRGIEDDGEDWSYLETPGQESQSLGLRLLYVL